MKALVIGGTGPTGPAVVQGLLGRGYQVAIFHRGTHETGLPADVEHIHADPHFLETLQEGLSSRTFDLVISMYGRLRYVAEALKGKTHRFIAIGGVAVYRGWFNPDQVPPEFHIPVPEDAPLEEAADSDPFARLMVEAEKAVMEGHRQGGYVATLLRFPMIYGPRQLIPGEWCILRRILDKRPHIIVPDGGLLLETRGYAENMAHAVLLCVDHPQKSAGQVYNTGDETVFSLKEWIDLIARFMGYSGEVVSLPAILARPAAPYALWGRPGVFQSGKLHHRVVAISKIKAELGYRDVVPAQEGVRRTCQFYLENPPERGGEIEQRLNDPFDYEREDRLIRTYQEGLRPALEVWEAPQWRHPYPHPKRPKLRRDEVGR